MLGIHGEVLHLIPVGLEVEEWDRDFMEPNGEWMARHSPHGSLLGLCG
jgi:hypothetical protein